MGRPNTKIDHWLSNTATKTGTMLILKDFEAMKHEGKCLRDRAQSDHLALFTWIKFNPIVSLR